MTRNVIALVLSVAICLGVGALGGWATARAVGTWYTTLDKPSWNPPNWIFGPVWTALYIMMGIAAWMIWRHGPSTEVRLALTAFVVQLGLNLLWSFLFFGMQRIDLGLVDIVVLWVAIAITIALFARIQHGAAALLVPYLLWVSFATALNASLWMRNG